MSGIEYMLVGISALLIGIYIILLQLAANFFEYLIIGLLIIGIVCCITGFIKFFKE